ncbi:MAG: ATP-dependent helicase HrpB [Flavobacteriales bacterium]|nr:ATP-dependent helicase HrpB [Flavobacteriales bacterium]
MISLEDIDLPIKDVLEEIELTLRNESSLIIGAPPGAGKSTILPLVLLKSLPENQKILMLEPRRLAAISIAERMADLLKEPVGKTVGYKIRFEDRTSVDTRIQVITEGILTKIIQNDNELSGIDMIIFDEFHERSIHADLALALSREAQKILRPDLKILIMSATLNMPRLSVLLQAPIIESKGRQYPVEIINFGQCDERLIVDLTVEAVIKAFVETNGDILVFLPGQMEISQCQERLRKRLNAIICPLFGMLNKNLQRKAIQPIPGKRKVVLATSIAETSLTIEGVTAVVDSGFGRTSEFDPNSGLSRLKTIRISKDSADQRAGRAGRLGPGKCYRLWSKADDLRLQESREPEILRMDLAPLLLEIYLWGTTEFDQLDWLDTPKQGNLKKAKSLLEQLEAIEDERITDHGRAINELPAHPRIANMLLTASKEGLIELGCDLAAVLEERDPMNDVGIDINIRIDGLRKYRADGNTKGRFAKIDRISRSYLRQFGIDPDNETVNPYDTGYLLARTFPERIAHSRPGNNAQFQLANGRYASAGHKDDLAFEQWLVIANMDARSGLGKIFLASPINPKDLAPMVKEKEILEWNTSKGGLVATIDLRIGNIVLQSKPLRDYDTDKKLEVIKAALQNEGADLLNFNDEVINWQNRVSSLRKWNQEQDWMDVHTNNLLKDLSWIEPYLNEVKTNDDLEKLDLLSILNHSLDYEKQNLLKKLAPEVMEVPSGSKIKLKYAPDGSAPILSVRIQELFGMTASPLVNGNKQPVKLHLLSPGFKPVQVTSDLQSFWANTYPEVKKELKGRYPKHFWPENPLEAQPTSKAKRKKSN